MPAPERSAIADRKQTHEVARLAKRLRHAAGRAMADYNLIGGGDRVMVCRSGGNTSWSLLDLLLSLQAKAPGKFEPVAADPQLFDLAAPGSRAETSRPDTHAWLGGDALA